MNDLHFLVISTGGEAPFVSGQPDREIPLTCHLSNDPVSIGKVAVQELFVLVPSSDQKRPMHKIRPTPIN
jgi:hypothetical protein